MDGKRVSALFCGILVHLVCQLLRSVGLVSVELNEDKDRRLKWPGCIKKEETGKCDALVCLALTKT